MRRRWTFSASAAMLSESNAVRRTDEEEVFIAGLPFPFRLDRNARASSGTGLLLSGGGSFSPTIGEDLRGALSVSAAGKLYQNPDWNDVTVKGEAGFARLFDKGALSGGLGLGRRWIGDLGFNLSLGPWARGRVRLSDATHLLLAARAERQKHDELPDYDGWLFAADQSVIRRVNSRTSIQADLSLELVTAREGRHSSRLAGAGLSATRAFGGGLSVTLGASAHVRQYAAPIRLLRKTRTDQRYRLSAHALHRSLQFHGFAPYVGVSLESNRSNIPLYSWRNYGATLGVAHTF